MSSVAASAIDEFVSDIQPVVGAHAFDSALDAYAVDAIAPAAAVAPADLPQLQAVLAEAHEAGLAVIAIGRRSRLSLGNPPEAYDIAVSTSRIDRVLAHEPADLTVTVEAGVPLAALQRRLAGHGQFLPLDPLSPGATIGGVLATNAFGPMRHARGTARDWLIGLRVVHAGGSSTKSGGRVVKNVAGYDMHKLHIGALGTLGIIAEATFKLAPLPPVGMTVAVECRSARDAAAAALAAWDAGLSLQSLELLSPPAAHSVLDASSWSLLAHVAGGAAAVERSLREIRALAAPTGARVDERPPSSWDAWRTSFAPATLSLRVGVQPAQVAQMVDILDRRLIGAAPMISATIAAGVIRVQLEPARDARALSLVQSVREVVDRAGGSVVVEAAPLSVKRQIDVFGPLRPDVAIMRRLKQEFDPKRILAPGRFVGRL